MMLCRSTLPLSKALPVASRLFVMRTAYPATTRAFHISAYPRFDSKSTYATVAPNKSESTSTNVPPSPDASVRQEKKQESMEIARKGGETHIEDVQAKRDFFWTHPVYTRSEYEKIQIGHHEATAFSEYVALGAVKLLRSCFDFFTGYKHSPELAKGQKVITAENTPKPVQMTEKDWMLRILFLETVAGVPGMVGGMLRHLKSLRKLEKEGRWIETLLEEAENERMHLMTFMAIKKPGFWMRMTIVGAQGVFCNAFFFAYLISPRTCHRFVGYLEEEAVITYSRCLADYKAGLLPEWSSKDFKVPDIAKDYWHLPPDCTMEDLLLAIRADEAGHRHVNHTLASLESRDKNPFTPEELERNNRTKEDCMGMGWDRDDLKL